MNDLEQAIKHVIKEVHESDEQETIWPHNRHNAPAISMNILGTYVLCKYNPENNSATISLRAEDNTDLAERKKTAIKILMLYVEYTTRPSEYYS